MNNKPKSLYIHIPFCSSICDYCDFTKLQFFSHLADSYLESLFKEIDFYQIENNLKTIYIGGGTPSVLSPIQLEKLLSKLSNFSSCFTSRHILPLYYYSSTLSVPHEINLSK